MKTNYLGKRFFYRTASVIFILLISIMIICLSCSKDEDPVVGMDSSEPFENPQYTITQAISDEAQGNTISFDGLAFLTGNLGSQSFLPPGKVADYSGFQFFRDNDPTKLGHNTSFVTIISFNILHLLTSTQINMFVEKAQSQIDMINEFSLKRFPLLKALRRLKDGELPSGTTQLSKEALMAYTAELYRIDGQISYDRAQLFGEVINSFSPAQRAKFAALKELNGIGNWDSTLANPLEGFHLQKDISVAVMTYASEIYSWYAGSVTSDVYFCPERHGTYFGSFYLKDWPAMGNPNFTIDETLTANAGQNFLAILTTTQSDKVKNIVNLQRDALTEIVAKRKAISTELRKFLSSQSADQASILALSARYGELDGELSYYYATTFTEVFNSFSDEQKTKLTKLSEDLGYSDPVGAFLYSEPTQMPDIDDTDFMFR
jgi:hypothetical protein